MISFSLDTQKKNVNRWEWIVSDSINDFNTCLYERILVLCVTEKKEIMEIIHFG